MAHVNTNNEERGNRMYIIQFIRGFCMALADSVPGVSGGTVAFLLGFYDQFIDSIDDLITGNMEKKKTAFFFLLKLGIGWVTGCLVQRNTVIQWWVHSPINNLFNLWGGK